MKRNLFKKLSLVMALALVVTAMAPAAAPIKAAANPTLNATSKTIYVGKSFNFNVKNKVKKSKYAWTSSNKKVATVNAKNGVAKAVAPGTATISCKITLPNKKNTTLKATVTVKQDATAVAINNPVSEVKVGDATYQFKRTITPKASTNKTFYVIEESSNTAKAVAVNDKGVINVGNSGEFRIKAVTARGRIQFAAGNYKAESEWLTVKVAAPSVTTIEAFSSNSVKVSFEDAISSEVKVNNFSINGQVIASATLASDAKSVMLKLSTSLNDGSEYTLTTKDILAAVGTATSSDTKTFTYKKAEAASIEFTSSTYLANGKDVTVIVKDANGNDITSDYSDYEVTTTDPSVISKNLITGYIGTSTVNVTISNTTISTGDKLITIKEGTASDISIAFASFDYNGGNGNDLAVVVDNSREIFTIVENQDGIVIDDHTKSYSTSNATIKDDVVYTFRSSDPSIAAVDSFTREVTGKRTGTAIITITATYDGVTTAKDITVTVRNESYPKSIRLFSSAEAASGRSTQWTSTATVVRGATGVGDDGFCPRVYDQYGNEMKAHITLEFASNKYASFSRSSNVYTSTLSAGTGWFGVYADDTADTGSVSIKAYVTDDTSVKTTAVIRVVNAGRSAGYNVNVGRGIYNNVSTPTIDINRNTTYSEIFEAPSVKDTNYKGSNGVNDYEGEDELTINVYAKDHNGNQTARLSYGTGENQFVVEVNGTASKNVVTVITGSAIDAGVDGNESKAAVVFNPDYNATGGPSTGTGSVTVYVYERNSNNVVVKKAIKTISFTVTDSCPSATKVKQVSNSISVEVGDYITENIRKAFIVSDQYNRALGDSLEGYDFNYTIKAYSTNSAIVKVEDNTEVYAQSAGVVDIVVYIAGVAYDLTVVVK